MEESYIAGKFQDQALTPEFIDALANIAATYVVKWTQTEFNKLTNNSKNILCWQLPNGSIRVGTDTIVAESGYWRRLDAGLSRRGLFSDQRIAILYSLCRFYNQVDLADSILKYDSEVRILQNDIAHYQKSLERSIRNKDSFRIGVWSTRYDDAKLMLVEAQQQLKKFITKAKYSIATTGTGK
jgi:hypothetical protein